MPGKHWGELEVLLLKQLQEEGKDISEVKIPGKKRAQVRQKALRMGLITPSAARTTWPRRQINILKKAKADGLTPQNIHEQNLLGDPYRSLWAIKKAWERKKLSDRKRARLLKKKKIWSHGEKERFHEYLREHSSTLTPEEIAKKWKIARSTVVNHQMSLGIKLRRKEVLALPGSKRKRRLSARKSAIKTVERWNKWREVRIDELENIASTMREKGPITERICSDCNISLPLKPQFYDYQDRKFSSKGFTGTKRLYKRRCRLCEAKRRREQTAKKKKS